MPADKPRAIAIIGTGEMGAAMGARARHLGARVLTMLSGRSAASVERVRRGGLEVVDNELALVSAAEVVLSIVPPAVALEVAQQFAPALSQSPNHPIFLDCNAISPRTASKIATLLVPNRMVDGGIMGPPPALEGPVRTVLAVSGEHAREVHWLDAFFPIKPLDGPIGFASGLKCSYAGLTKGLTALAAATIGAATRYGLAEPLLDEYAHGQPELLKWITRQLPGMYHKAYRWVDEMEQIADFMDGEGRGGQIYRGMARLYELLAAQIAESAKGGADATDQFDAIEAFVKISKARK